MRRTEKIAAIEQLSGRFREAPHVFVTSFFGMTVGQATELRKRIRAAGGTYQVVKNRLAKRATSGTPMEPLAPSLTGPRAVAFHETDPLALARVLSEFAANNPQLEIVAGVIDARSVLDPERVNALAKLPGLPELRARLLCVIQTPATMLVRILGTPATQVARVIDARNKKTEAQD